MARTTLPDAVLAKDVILACGGEIKPKERKMRQSKKIQNPTQTDDTEAKPKSYKKATKRNGNNLTLSNKECFIVCIKTSFIYSTP